MLRMGRTPCAPCWVWLLPTLLQLVDRVQSANSIGGPFCDPSDHATRAAAHNNNDNNDNQQSHLMHGILLRRHPVTTFPTLHRVHGSRQAGKPTKHTKHETPTHPLLHSPCLSFTHAVGAAGIFLGIEHPMSHAGLSGSRDAANYLGSPAGLIYSKPVACLIVSSWKASIGLLRTRSAGGIGGTMVQSVDDALMADNVAKTLSGRKNQAAKRKLQRCVKRATDTYTIRLSVAALILFASSRRLRIYIVVMCLVLNYGPTFACPAMSTSVRPANPQTPSFFTLLRGRASPLLLLRLGWAWLPSRAR